MGVGGLLLLFLIAARFLHPAGADVVLITVDTLRADHLNCYGGEGRTPGTDRLAATGALFERAATNLPRTTPAVATMMTGRYPAHHGVRFLKQPLPEEEATLAERLAGAGFRTGAFVAGGPLGPGTGLHRGFATYLHYVDRSAPALTLRVLPWLAWNFPRRSFLWVHFFDPHFLYVPPWPYSRRYTDGPPPGFSVYRDLGENRLKFGTLYFTPPLTEAGHAYVRALYRGEVEYSDLGIQWLLRALRFRDLVVGRRSLVVFTADHGESLGEHACWYEHGEFLYEEDVEIPFIVAWPGIVQPARRSNVTAELIDLAPTVLDLLALPPLPAADGRSLAPALRDQPMPPRPAFAESGEKYFPENPRRPVEGVEGKWRSVRAGDWKLILIPLPGGEELELYDLREDPRETKNLVAAEPERVAALRELLRAWMASPGRGAEEPPMDEERLKLLRSLGYVD